MTSPPANTNPANSLSGVTSQPVNTELVTSVSGVPSQPVITDAPVRLPGAVVYKSALKCSGPLQSALKKTVSEENCDDSDASSLRTIDDSDGSKSLASCESSPSKSTKSNRHVSFSASPSVYPIENLSEYNVHDSPSCFSRSGSCGERLKYFGGIDCRSFASSPPAYVGSHVDAPSAQVCKIVDPQPQLCIKSKAVITTTPLTCVVDPARKARDGNVISSSASSSNYPNESHAEESTLGDNRYYFGVDMNKIPGRSSSSVSGPQASLIKNSIAEQNTDMSDAPESRISQIKERLSRKVSPKLANENILCSPRASGKIFNYDIDCSKLPSNSAHSSHSGHSTSKSSGNSFVNAGLSFNTSSASTAMLAGPVSPTKITTPASIISSRGAIAALAKGPKTKTVKVIPIASKIKIEAPKIKTSPTSPKVSPTDSSSSNLPKEAYESVQSSICPTARTHVQNSEFKRHSSDFSDFSVSAGLEENSIERICAQASAIALDIAGTATSEGSCISNLSSPSIDSIDTLLSKVHVNLEENDGTFGLCPNSETSMSNDVSMESIQQVSLSEELEGTNAKNVIADEMQMPKKYQRFHYIIREESDINEETSTRDEVTHGVVSVDNEQFCITSESNGNKENGSAIGTNSRSKLTINNHDTYLPTPRHVSCIRSPSNLLLSTQGKRPGSLDSNDEGSDQSYSEAYVEALSPSEAFDANLKCSVGESLSLNRVESNRTSSSTSIPAFYDEGCAKTVLSHLSKFDHQQDSEDDVSEGSFCSASPGEEKMVVSGVMSSLDKQSDCVPDEQCDKSTSDRVNPRVNLKIELTSSDMMNSVSVVDTLKTTDALSTVPKCAGEIGSESKDYESVTEFEGDTSSSIADGRIQLAGGDIEICGDLDISESPSSISHSSKIASIKNELLQADSTDASEECSTASGQVVSDAESSLSELSGSLRKDDDDITRKPSKVSNIVNMFSEGPALKLEQTSERTILRSKPKTVRLRTSIPIASASGSPDVSTTKTGARCINTPGSNSSLLRYKKRNAFSSKKAMFEKLEKSNASNPSSEQKSLKVTPGKKEGNNSSASCQKIEVLKVSSSSSISALGSSGDSDVNKSSLSCTSSVKTSSTDSEVAIAENFHPKLKKHARKKSGVFEVSSEAEKRLSSQCGSDRESPRTTASFDSDMGSLSSISTIPEQDAVRNRTLSYTLSSLDRGRPGSSRQPLNKKHCDNSTVRAFTVEKVPKSNISAGKFKSEPKTSWKLSNTGQKLTPPRSRRKSGDKPSQALDEKRNSSSESSLCESSTSDSYEKCRSKQQASSIPCHSRFVPKTEKDSSASGARLRETRATADTTSAESSYYKNSHDIAIQSRSTLGKKTSVSCARFANDFGPSSTGKRTSACPSKSCESKSLKMNSANKSRGHSDSAAVDHVKELADQKLCGSTRMSNYEENLKTQSSGNLKESFPVQLLNDSPELIEFETSTRSSKAPSLSPCDLDSNLKTSTASKKSIGLTSSVSDTSDDCELKQLIEHLEKEHDELEHRSKVVAAAALRKKTSGSKSRKIPRVQKLISQFETK